MRKLFYLLLLPIFVFAATDELVVNNRILATVNGKTISCVDVMKKLDLFLSKNYPTFDKSPENRLRFFSQNWRYMLDQMIETELILADAEKMELKINDAEVREKVHERFGPNVMATLDSLGLKFEEAWRMIYSEIAVQRMSWFRVHSKALHKVGPQYIKKAYQEYLEKNPPKEEWKYRVISIRALAENLGTLYAQKAHALIRGESLPFEDLVKKIQEESAADSSIKVTVSDEYQVEGKDLSDSHKAVLCSLQPNTYSDPVAQVSRTDKSTVHRIFYLSEHKTTPPPTFISMVTPLHEELVGKEIEKEFPNYIKKLRKQFNFDESELNSIPADFQPFILR